MAFRFPFAMLDQCKYASAFNVTFADADVAFTDPVTVVVVVVDNVLVAVVVVVLMPPAVAYKP